MIKNFILILALFASLVFIGCSDELDLMQPAAGGSDTTIIIKPEPEPLDSIYIVKDIDLSVSPSDNDDRTSVITGLIEEKNVDVYVYVEWRSSAESDMTLWVDDQPYALPDPMLRPADDWVRFTGVKLADIVKLGLTMDKGSAKKPDDGSDKRNANRVTKIVITTVGFRKP